MLSIMTVRLSKRSVSAPATGDNRMPGATVARIMMENCVTEPVSL